MEKSHINPELVSETKTNAIIKFSVSDTGIGIPKNRQKILFDQFTQVDSSTTRKYGGTGLGLSISKQLIEAMGGEIGVLSKENEGSLFWFTLKLKKQKNVDETSDIPILNMKGKKLLIVDKNKTDSQIIQMQLQDINAEIVNVSDGKSAINKLESAASKGIPYQVAIIDMDLPDITGEELGTKISLDKTLNTTSLIMITSSGKKGDAKRLESKGFSSYLTKPISKKDLLDTISAVLNIFNTKSIKKIVTKHSIREMRWDNIRVLIAEDNRINQKVAIGLLKKIGMEADVASNGLEAIKALTIKSYDLVLMDCQMPELDGYKATRRIRSKVDDIINPDIPIVAMTANAMQGDREKCLDAGMDDYISKPVDPNKLYKILEKWISKN